MMLGFLLVTVLFVGGGGAYDCKCLLDQRAVRCRVWKGGIDADCGYKVERIYLMEVLISLVVLCLLFLGVFVEELPPVF